MVWFFKKKKQENRYSFSEEERERSLEIRRLQAQLKQEQIKQEHQLMMLKLEKQKLELEADIAELSEEDEDDSEDLFTGLVSKALPSFIPTVFSPTQSEQTAPASQNFPPSGSALIDFSEEQIKAIWNNQPDKIKMIAKVAPDSHIVEYLQKKIPNISPDSCARALKIIKTA